MVSVKRELIFVLLLILMVGIADGGEVPKIEWDKTHKGITHSYSNFYGVGGEFILQTTDGGYIAVGKRNFSEYSSYPQGACLAIKFDDSGDMVWTKKLELFGNCQNRGLGVQKTMDDGFIVYQQDILVKLDNKGDIVWSRRIDHLRHIIQISNGSFVALASGLENNELWSVIAKLDSNGNEVREDKGGWVRMFKASGSFIQQTSDGGFVVTGSGRLSSTTGYGSTGVYALKFDKRKNTVWEKTYDVLETTNQDKIAYSIQETLDDGYVLVGRVWDARNSSTLIMKLDGSGNKIWEGKFGNRSEGLSILATLDGGYMVTGKVGDKPFYEGGFVGYVMKLDGKGNKVWEKIFNETREIYSIQQTSDRGYVVAGSNYGDSADFNYMYIIKFAADSIIKLATPMATVTQTPITSGIFTTSVKIYNEKGKETSEVHVGDAINLQFMLTNPIGSGNFVFISNSSLKSISIEPKNLIDRKNPTVTEYVVDEGSIPKSREESFKIMQELMSLPTVASSILTGNIPITYIVSKGYGIADMCTSPGCMVWAYSKGLKNRDRFLAANEIYEVIRKEGEGGGDGWIIPPGTTMVISANMTMPLVQQSIEPEVSINYRYVEMGTEPTNYAGWVQTNLFGQLDKHPTMNRDFVATASKEINISSKEKEKNIIDQIFEFFKNLFGW